MDHEQHHAPGYRATLEQSKEAYDRLLEVKENPANRAMEERLGRLFEELDESSLDYRRKCAGSSAPESWYLSRCSSRLSGSLAERLAPMTSCFWPNECESSSWVSGNGCGRWGQPSLWAR